MSIEIRIADFSFNSDEGEIWLSPYPNIVSASSPISDSIEASSFRVRVRANAFGAQKIYTVLREIYSTRSGEAYVVDSGDIMETSYAEPIYYYQDGVLRAKFYATSVQREGREVLLIEGTSAVGLLTKLEHRGGVYFGVNAGDIITDILQGMSCQIAPEVASVKCYGWLRATNIDKGLSARDNLQQVLFATGAYVVEDLTGTIIIDYPKTGTSKEIPMARTFLDGKNVRVTKNRISRVSLIEHTYFESQNATEEVVYDNTNGTYVTNHDVFFEKPYAIYRGSGITVNSSGANWANITGTGILYGTPYVHIQRELIRDTDDAGGRELTVKDATLVSSLNSSNVINRVVNYYQRPVQNVDILIESEKVGDFAYYHDVYGDAHSAFIRGIDETVSSFRKGTMTMINDWVPVDVGNTFTEYFIVTAATNGTITIPAAHRGKQALAVLFSGAFGGSGGYDGERGGNGATYSEGIVSKGYGGAGGAGGAAGEGGRPGRYLLADIQSLAASYSGTIGAGGAGGVHNGGVGSIGGDTVLGSFSTASGTLLDGIYVNMIDGSVYGQTGASGNAGRAGGKGGDLLQANKKGEDGAAGENYSSTARGGAGGLGVKYGSVTASGGGGGGGAYGASAQDSTQYTDAVNYATDGANAVAPPQAVFYQGGSGGNGGGGGGGSSYRYNGLSGNFRDPGEGGLGSVGGQGANGFILFYV